jgi:hypothetical protein
MPIITRTTAKTLLQISSTTYDTVIDALIPQLQNWVVEYLQNHFHVNDIYLTASTIAFVDSTTDTITDSDSGFVDADFTDSIDVEVEGSDRNDGIYAVDTVVAGTLTLASGETLTTEAAGESVTITRVKFPSAIQLGVSKLIGYHLDTKNYKGVQSESLADHSISYFQNSTSVGYPDSILASLAPWRKAYR